MKENRHIDDSNRTAEPTYAATTLDLADVEDADTDDLAPFKNTVLLGDCLRLLPCLPDKSVDMILADLPYEVTARNKWDKMIPIERLWYQYRRVIKDNGVIVLTGQGRFSAKMILAAENIYRYSLIWHKNKATGHLNAKRQPMRAHEDIMVFYKKPPVYHPQMTSGHEPLHYARNKTSGSNYGKTKGAVSDSKTTLRYPTSVLSIPIINNDDAAKIHPTQKPVELAAWLIRTFSDPGALVLDNACGSGAFLVAAQQEGRDFIGMEADPIFATHAQEWISRTQPLVTVHIEPESSDDKVDGNSIDKETDLPLRTFSSEPCTENAVGIEDSELNGQPADSN